MGRFSAIFKHIQKPKEHQLFNRSAHSAGPFCYDVWLFGCLVVWFVVLGFWRRVEGSWGVSWGVRGGPGSVPGGSLEGSWGVLVAPGALLGGSWAEGVRGKRFPGPPKTAQDGPSGPKTPPRRPQDSPGRPQEAPKTGQEAPKTAQEASKTPPKSPQVRSKTHPRPLIPPQDLPRPPKTIRR